MEILVIGGIAAGMSVAAKAKRENKDANITVIEKENYISFGACGLPYYLGKQFEDKNEMFARTPDQIEKSGINLKLQHEVTRVDFNNKTVEMKNLINNEMTSMSYDRLMIATGATPIVPPLEGIDAQNVYTFTRLEEVDRLKSNLDQYESIAIIGGGFIGVEVAEQLAGLNKKVHIIEAMSDVLSGPFDKEVTTEIKSALEDLNVGVHIDQMANKIKVENGLAVGVETSKATIKADAVIVSIGFRPNTAFLSGQLETLKNGAIVIDAYGQTSIEDVFAAGDCATVPHRFAKDKYIPLATYANKLGRLIGTNIVSDKKDWLKFEGALGSGFVKVGPYEAGVTGLTEKEALDLKFNIKTTTVFTNNHSNYYPNQDKIMIKLVYDAETFVLYGAQVYGKEGAALRLHALTTAVFAGLTTQEIGFIDYAYAPPFTSTWEAINVAANTAK